MTEEKRRFPRIVYQDGCYINYSEEKGLHEVMQRTKDLSMSGIALETNIQLDLETEVEIQVGDFDPPLQLKGVVRRCEPVSEDGEMFILGLEFTEVSDENQQRLEELMAARG